MPVNEKEYQRLVDEIGLYIKKAEQAFLYVKPAVDWIINNKVTNQYRIEKTLDTILGFVQLGIGIEEYHKLNDFYSVINPKEAKAYREIYTKISEEKY
jgi:hypothetical protein